MVLQGKHVNQLDPEHEIGSASGHLKLQHLANTKKQPHSFVTIEHSFAESNKQTFCDHRTTSQGKKMFDNMLKNCGHGVFTNVHRISKKSQNELRKTGRSACPFTPPIPFRETVGYKLRKLREATLSQLLGIIQSSLTWVF